AIGPVDDKEEAVLGRMEQHFAPFGKRGFFTFGFLALFPFGIATAADRPVNLCNDDRLGGGIIPCFGGSFLIMPEIFSGIGINRDDGGQEQVVAFSAGT